MVTIKIDEKVVGRVCDGALKFSGCNSLADVNHVLVAVMAGKNAELAAATEAKQEKEKEGPDPKPVPIPNSIANRLKGKK